MQLIIQLIMSSSVVEVFSWLNMLPNIIIIRVAQTVKRAMVLFNGLVLRIYHVQAKFLMVMEEVCVKMDLQDGQQD